MNITALSKLLVSLAAAADSVESASVKAPLLCSEQTERLFDQHQELQEQAEELKQLALGLETEQSQLRNEGAQRLSREIAQGACDPGEVEDIGRAPCEDLLTMQDLIDLGPRQRALSEAAAALSERADALPICARLTLGIDRSLSAQEACSEALGGETYDAMRDWTQLELSDSLQVLEEPITELEEALDQPSLKDHERTLVSLSELRSALSELSELQRELREGLAQLEAELEACEDGAADGSPDGSEEREKEREDIEPPQEDPEEAAPAPPWGPPRKKSERGSLSQEQIRSTVRDRWGMFRACYVSERKKNSSLRGDIKVQFIVSDQGQVVWKEVESSTLHNKRVESCVVERLSKLTFPSPSGGSARVSYVFRFEGRSGGKSGGRSGGSQKTPKRPPPKKK